MFFTLCLLAGTVANAQQTFVPDDNFEQALIDLGFDSGPLDDQVLTANISGVTTLFLDFKFISDLTGIEDFTALTRLSCLFNQLTSLDVSNNHNLTTLSCVFNQLTSLDISDNPNLTELNCDENQLTSLDFSNAPNLTKLTCSNNQLTDLGLSYKTNYIELSCLGNPLTSLDLSNNPDLLILSCGGDMLTGVDVSNNTKLERLSISSVPFSSVDLSHSPDLRSFSFGQGQLTSLDLSHNPKLESLNLNNSLLTGLDLDLSNNPELTDLECQGSQLASLDLRNSTKLESLNCPMNQLTSLDLSNCPALDFMLCHFNQLTSLDLRNGTNNSSGIRVRTGNNPDLTCIAVDDPVWSTANWTSIDAHTSFSDNCNDYELTDSEADNCYLAASIDISTAQGNNNSFLSVLDANGNLVCEVKANGNDLGMTDFYVYRSSTDRTDNGVPYMRRDVEISPANQPTSPVDVVIYYAAAELAALVAADPTVTDESDLNFIKSDASCSGAISGTTDIIPQLTSGTYGLNGDVYVTTRVFSFSTFYASKVDVLLPVELISFTAQKNDKNVILKWQTANEVNNRGYEIQKSRNGLDWEYMGFVNGTGTTSEVNSYQFIDRQPFSGINYYRLKQSDFDGAFNFSPIVNVEFTNARNLIDVYPNPSSGSINIQANNPEDLKMSLRVVDQLGRTVWENDAAENTSSGRFELGVEKSGIYFVSVQIGKNIYTERVVVFN